MLLELIVPNLLLRPPQRGFMLRLDLLRSSDLFRLCNALADLLRVQRPLHRLLPQPLLFCERRCLGVAALLLLPSVSRLERPSRLCEGINTCV